MKEKLNKITAEFKAQASLDLLEQAQHWIPLQKAQKVALFVSKMDEMDTFPLIHWCLKNGKQVYLPFVSKKVENEAPEWEMDFAEIQNLEDDLIEGPFQLMEPKMHLRNRTPERLDLVFLPGLVYDAHGGRVGRGKGFYDKFLKGKSYYTCGLCFDFQIQEEDLKLEEFDRNVDAILTPKRVVHIRID